MKKEKKHLFQRMEDWIRNHPVAAMVICDIIIVVATPFITKGIIKMQAWLWDQGVYTK